MKPIDNRQNKLAQTKASAKHFSHETAIPSLHAQDFGDYETGMKGGAIFGLISNLFFASKIAQSAKHTHLGVHNFDKAGPLLEHATAKPPLLVIIDWDGCEAEGYKLLKAWGANAELKKIPVVGYLSNVKADVKAEAERAGCHRVYSKTEFTRTLDDLLLRYST